MSTTPGPYARRGAAWTSGPTEDTVMLSAELLTKAASAGASIAGSVIAASPARRLGLHRALRAHDLWTHIDRISGGYAGQPGISPDHLAQLAETDPGHLDVHLMVDDPAAELSALPRRVARVHIQCEIRQPDSVTCTSCAPRVNIACVLASTAE